MSEQVLGFLGLMRRAGALAVGAEDVFDAARDNKARVLVTASDAAKNTLDAMHNAAAQREEPIAILRLPCTKVCLCDMLENEQQILSPENGQLRLYLRGFEVKTLRLKK